MITALVEVVEGWTDALPFVLKADAVAVDLTGLTVSCFLKDTHGTVIRNSTVGVTVTDTTAGAISYTPQSTSEFVASRTPYKIRFQVTSVTTEIAYFPNIDEDVIKVNAV